MERAKRIKFDPSLAKTRALESATVRKYVQEIEQAVHSLTSCTTSAVALNLPAECCERNIELILVSRLGLSGVECMRTAASMVPKNFLGRRTEFVTAIFNETSGQSLLCDSCEAYLSLLEKCPAYTAQAEPQLKMKHLAHLSEVKGISHAIFLSPPFLHCINPCCRRRGIPLTIHHTPVKVTVFTSSGPLPGCKIALRCSACSVIYNYSKYGNKQKEGERFYDERRDLIEVSDVVYCERQLSDLFTFLK